MPRPNVDIPNYLIGGVKDYARKHGLSRDEAHSELLESALRNDGIISNCSDDENSDE